MAKDPSKTGGPPEGKGPPPDVVDHLIEVHTSNGTLDQIVGSAIGGSVQEHLYTQTGFVSGWTPAYGFELWSYTGGTTVTLLADINPGPGSSSAGVNSGFTEFNGSYYFLASDPINGNELRKLDADGTVSVIDINPGSASSNAGAFGFKVFNDALYFIAEDAVYGFELRKLASDGTISLVADILDGPAPSYPGAFSGYVEFNGDLYFNAFAPGGLNAELHKLDGETGQVSLVADIYVGSGSSLAGAQSGFAEFDGTLYFAATTAAGRQLFEIDASGSLTAIPGTADAGDFGGLHEYNGSLYFSATDPALGSELFKLDSSGSVSLVADINSGPQGSTPGIYGFTELNGELYFTATDSLFGYELRKLDSDGNVSLVADIYTGPLSSHAGVGGKSIEFNGDLYFKATDPIHGEELRRLNGTTGTVDTFDFYPGVVDSWAEPLGVVNGQLAIAAWIDPDGAGPSDFKWTMLVSDGTPTSVADFQIVDDGSGQFEPNFMFVADGFFLI